MRIFNYFLIILILINPSITIYANNILIKELEEIYPDTYNRHSIHQFNNDPMGMLQLHYKLNREDYILEIEDHIGHDDTPVLYIEPDLTFFLLYKNKELKYQPKSTQYLNLMAVYNIPISTYIILTQSANKQQKQQRLNLLGKLIESAINNLNNGGFSKAEIIDTYNLLTLNLKWIQHFTNNDNVTTKEVKTFSIQMRPVMDNVLKLAIYNKMDVLNDIINQIQNKTGKDTPKTMIIFRGNPFHRQKSSVELLLEHKYKIISAKSKTKKNYNIFYIDAWQSGYDASIEGLANFNLDQNVAKQFYGNASKFNSNLGYKYAKQYLSKLK